MTYLRRLILAIVLSAGIFPAFAQAPAPVPALPDTERRITYVISASTCACAVNFALYGDNTDYQDWVGVYLNGVQQLGNWTISSPSGSLTTLPRPITDAVLTFSAPQTGTVQIVGARRPRRTSQFQENQGVSARSLNQVLTDIISQNREIWDKTNDLTGRVMAAPAGESLPVLPPASSRANQGVCFNSNGNVTPCVSIPSSTFSPGTGITFTGTGPTTISATPVSTATDPGSITNCTLTAAVAGNALTVALKTQAGLDPTASDPCAISFRNASASLGNYSPISVTVATSFTTATSGSTFGASNNAPFRLWVTAWNNGGVVLLGLSKQSSPTGIFPIEEGILQSSTACNACGTATLTGTFYTTTALTNKAIRILGYMDWANGLTTAGTFSSGPTTIQLMGPGIRKPGDAVQTATASFTTNVTTTSTTPVNTGLSVSITPTAAPNLMQIASFGPLGANVQNIASHAKLARGGTSIGQPTAVFGSAGGQLITGVALFNLDAPGVTTSTNYSVQYWTQTGAGTAIWIGGAGDGSIIQATEIQG